MNTDPFYLEDVPANWSGVYRIMLDGVSAYVGQSSDIRRRLKQHGIKRAMSVGLFKGVAFKELHVIFTPCEGLRRRLKIESIRIKQTKPLCNNHQMNIGRVIHYRKPNYMNPQFRKFVRDVGSQSKVATLLDMSSGHVSLLFNGKRKITPKMAERIEIASKGKYSRQSLVFGIPKRTAK